MSQSTPPEQREDREKREHAERTIIQKMIFALADADIDVNTPDLQGVLDGLKELVARYHARDA